MLPFSGQGANSALEDAGTLGYLFKHINTASEVERGLQLFYRARYARVGRVQTLSSVRAGREMEIQGKLQKYSDPPGSSMCAPCDIVHLSH
jgi:salicylate hydroxylase